VACSLQRPFDITGRIEQAVGVMNEVLACAACWLPFSWP
jgi:hypothetical protein